MAKKKSFFCTECGTTCSQWQGQCQNCGAWNTIKEQTFTQSGINLSGASDKVSLTSGVVKDGLRLSSLSQAIPDAEARFISTINEFDRALGGGLVKGSAVLIGGNPGIGKSTLLLQAADGFTRQGLSVAYISGEEAEAQVKLRAQRLGLSNSRVKLGVETDLGRIISVLINERPDIVIIDSIQTIWSDQVDASSGQMTQLRLVTQALVQLAKTSGTAVMLIGHVTKDGQLAGPRMIEHLVDTVVYFEGDSTLHFRILRSIKNRFGPTDEIGVFTMMDSGLQGVDNPSELFLTNPHEDRTGSVVFAGIEGSRTILSEIQALVAPSHQAQPRRSALGIDKTRLAMLLAVLEARCQINLGAFDIYVNVAGGLRIFETAVDLAVIASIVSAYRNVSIGKETVFFGEVGLSGHLRPVIQSKNRLNEAVKLGFKKAFLPDINNKVKIKSIQTLYVSDVQKFVENLL